MDQVNQHIFTVYGSPVAQGRPRFVRRGNFVGTYDPANSRDWKRTVQSQLLTALDDKPEIHEGALSLQLHFYLPRPKSLPKRAKDHIKKPDVDNLAKGVKDAMKGIVYRDDSQVVELLVRKEYNTTPRVVIGVEMIE